MNRVIYGGLAVVAGCAAILSFVSLTSLATRCGFDPKLAWLLPLVVDAGAAVATAIWLRTTSTFARAQALVLLAVSVIGNGLDHYLAAYQLAPPWLLVVAVAAIPPATLGATIHLARQGLTPVRPAPVADPLTQSQELAEPAAVEPRTVADVVAAAPAPSPDHSVTAKLSTDEMRDLARGRAAQWGAAELRRGSTAGKKKLLGQFPQLSEHFALEASKAAQRLADEPVVRAVSR